MENITNPILDSSPPFEISSGGDSVSNSFTKYQKQIYNDALNYATSKNDKDPKAFANKAALDSVVTHGSNNPFGDIATKTETGVIKNGIKYKNYNDISQPLSKKYDEFLINEHNTQLEQNAIVAQDNQVDNEMQQQQQIQQKQSPNIPQSVDMASMEQPIINQNQPVELPQQTTSLDVAPQQIDKQQADQIVSQKNNIDQTMMNNPIQNQHAYGGYSGNSYEGDGNLNSFNVGGLHETNPNGGIPLGVGQNQKQNTVEQGETSVDINGKKFIFSNRITI